MIQARGSADSNVTPPTASTEFSHSQDPERTLPKVRSFERAVTVPQLRFANFIIVTERWERHLCLGINHIERPPGEGLQRLKIVDVVSRYACRRGSRQDESIARAPVSIPAQQKSVAASLASARRRADAAPGRGEKPKNGPGCAAGSQHAGC
jgi:hypothetical protein